MEKLALDFNYVFFTLYNEYTTIEQDMDYLIVGLFFPIGLIAAVHIYEMPFGTTLSRGQRLYVITENIKLISGGDLHVFQELFNRASYTFSEIVSNYVFTTV